MSHIFTEKNIRDFNQEVFERYIRKHGYSLSKLDEYTFIPLHLDFPPKFYEQKGNVKKPLLTHYALELVSRGCMVQNDTEFCLTPEGYTKGYRYKHPVKYFFKAHWQWFFGVIIMGFIIAVATVSDDLIT
ncbi:hypothetical protein EAG18_19150 [Pseudoalteromonas sp. J010]|uniref:hypothetical protein n=1 Tax=Pseudoalteromonas sp. J010 TaxID=998465 RepID=UPI000F6457C3|nr:hypothetical protein [Pseudoalteromonas sp. J010]RRS07064.1 hypothetical protein EAG18_19150 [Pseudoalteromonas sp. J010]